MSWFGSKKEEPKQKITVTPEIIEEKVKAFILKKSKLVQSDSLSRNTKLFSSGLLDSLTFIQLVLFLEKEFQLQLSKQGDLGPDQLDTIDLMIPIVVRARNSE